MPPDALVLSAGSLSSLPVAGMPLLTHSIRAALPHCRRVLVHATSADEAALARDAGVETIPSPADAAGGSGPLLVLSAQFPVRARVTIPVALALLDRSGADAVLTGLPLTDRLWAPGPEGARRLDPHPYSMRQVFNFALLAEPRGAHAAFAPAGRIEMLEISADEAASVSRPAHLHALTPILRELLATDARERLARIGLIVFDFDGVMTDNRVLTLEDGTEGCMANRSDGLGIALLRDAAIPAVVVSKERNPVVAARCAKLRLECHQGVDDKVGALDAILASRDLAWDRVAYMGNDINDLACMRRAAVAVAPADAHPDVLPAAHLVTTRSGGHGAVRELIDWAIAAQKDR